MIQLTEKQQIVKRLLESKAITFEESLVLCKKDKEYIFNTITYPCPAPYPAQPMPLGYWWQNPVTINSGIN